MAQSKPRLVDKWAPTPQGCSWPSPEQRNSRAVKAHLRGTEVNSGGEEEEEGGSCSSAFLRRLQNESKSQAIFFLPSLKRKDFVDLGIISFTGLFKL